MSILTEAIKDTLTPLQLEAYPHLKWLFGLGPRGSGRTQLLALIIIEQSLERGWVPIFNHDTVGVASGTHFKSVGDKEMVANIAKLIDLTPQLEMQVRGSLGGSRNGQSEVRVRYKRDENPTFTGKWEDVFRGKKGDK